MGLAGSPEAEEKIHRERARRLVINERIIKIFEMERDDFEFEKSQRVYEAE